MYKETQEVNDNIIMDKNTNLSYTPYEIFKRTILASNNNTVNNWYKNNGVVNFVYPYVVDTFRYMKLNNKGKFSNEVIGELERVLTEMKGEKDKTKYFKNYHKKVKLTNIEILFMSVVCYYNYHNGLINSLYSTLKNEKYHHIHVYNDINIQDVFEIIYIANYLNFIKHSFKVNGMFNYKRILQYFLYGKDYYIKTLIIKKKIHQIVFENNLMSLDYTISDNVNNDTDVDNSIINSQEVSLNYIHYSINLNSKEMNEEFYDLTNNETTTKRKECLETMNKSKCYMLSETQEYSYSNNSYIEKVISLLELNVMNDLTLVYKNHLSFRIIDESFNVQYNISKHFNNLYEKAIYLIENYHITYDIITIRKLRLKIQKEYRQYEKQQKEVRKQQKEVRKQQKEVRKQQKEVRKQQKEKQTQEDFNKKLGLEVYELFYNVASNLDLNNQYLNKLEYIKQNINKVTTEHLYQMYKLTQNSNRKESYKNCISVVYKNVLLNNTI